MARGISVHVGVNVVDPALFSAAQLKGCENDAAAMFEVARGNGFEAREPFLSERAIFANVVPAVVQAAEELSEGDIFLFTFAGHGTRRAEQSSHPGDLPDEADFQDETLLLHDRILLDDFIRRALWSKFRPGVRIVAVADSCHSGTSMLASLAAPTPPPLTPFPAPGPFDALDAGPQLAESAAKAAPDSARVASGFEPSVTLSRGFGLLRRVKLLERFLDPPPSVLAGSEAEPAAEPFLAREISDAAAAAHLAQLAAEYEKLRNDLPTGEAARLKASLLTLAACRDYEKTPDDEPHGVFTQALLDALVGAPASYEALRDGIAEKLNGRPQTPVLSAPPPGPDFRSQRPFTI